MSVTAFLCTPFPPPHPVLSAVPYARHTYASLRLNAGSIMSVPSTANLDPYGAVSGWAASRWVMLFPVLVSQAINFAFNLRGVLLAVL